jgi:hypothetical protein
MRDMDFKGKMERCKKWQRSHDREDREDREREPKTPLPPRVIRVYSLEDNENGNV